MEKFDDYKEMLEEKVDDLVDEHPVGVVTVFTILGLALAVPICALAYKYVGKAAGKSAAKELMKAGVYLGYNHP